MIPESQTSALAQIKYLIFIGFQLHRMKPSKLSSANEMGKKSFYIIVIDAWLQLYTKKIEKNQFAFQLC